MLLKAKIANRGRKVKFQEGGGKKGEEAYDVCGGNPESIISRTTYWGNSGAWNSRFKT